MTERKSTGASPLLDMIMEIYDTKARMKKVLDTESDDFEEYASLSTNMMVDYYNEGYINGFNDGVHVIFPDRQLTPEDWEEGLKDHVEFVPSIPSYSTGEDIDNLVVVMRDNLRCRELLKAALLTQSDEFVTYPDLFLELCDQWATQGYEQGFEDGYNKVIDERYPMPTITQDITEITITNNADFGDIYYWFDDDIVNKHLYTGPFEINHDCTVHAYLLYYEFVSEIASLQCTYWPSKYFSVSSAHDLPAGNAIACKGWGYYYSYDAINWTSPSSYQIIFELSDEQPRVYFKGGSQYEPLNSIPLCIWSATRDIEVSGNIGSLAVGDDFNSFDFSTIYFCITPRETDDTHTYIHSLFKDDWSDNYAPVKYARNLVLPPFGPKSLQSATYEPYEYMFEQCKKLLSAPKLPNIMYGSRYCGAMFWNCIALTTPPVLPATTLANYCYDDMFMGCTALTTAPALPATTLADYCYNGMFYSCTALTTAPALPATTLADHCYNNMFHGCTALTTAPELPATTLAVGCYNFMFIECSSLTTAPVLPATTLADGCYAYMFYKCISLTTAPVLPATTLFGGCYNYMFMECSQLNYVKCLAVNLTTTVGVITYIHTAGWLHNVASNGTFVKAAGVTWDSGDSGIPSGWTVQDAA